MIVKSVTERLDVQGNERARNRNKPDPTARSVAWRELPLT